MRRYGSSWDKAIANHNFEIAVKIGTITKSA